MIFWIVDKWRGKSPSYWAIWEVFRNCFHLFDVTVCFGGILLKSSVRGFTVIHCTTVYKLSQQTHKFRNAIEAVRISFNLKAEFSFICQSNICPNYDQYVDKTPNNNKILDNWLISAGLHLYSCKHLLHDHRSITWKDGVSNLARRNNKMKTMCWNW